MSVGTTAGTAIRVSSGTPGSFDAAGYGALSFDRIGEVTSIPEFGAESNLVTHEPIEDEIIQKFKGLTNIGSMALGMALDTDDTGQIALKAAQASKSAYSFEIEHPNGDKYYFRALVMSFKVSLNTGNDLSSATVNLELTGQTGGTGIVEVLA